MTRHDFYDKTTIGEQVTLDFWGFILLYFVRILWFRVQPQKIARQNSKEPKLNTIHGSRTRTRNLNHRKSNLTSIASLIGGNSKESC